VPTADGCPAGTRSQGISRSSCPVEGGGTLSHGCGRAAAQPLPRTNAVAHTTSAAARVPSLFHCISLHCGKATWVSVGCGVLKFTFLCMFLILLLFLVLSCCCHSWAGSGVKDAALRWRLGAVCVQQ
jgi:hypothetical protein